MPGTYESVTSHSIRSDRGGTLKSRQSGAPSRDVGLVFKTLYGMQTDVVIIASLARQI